MKLASSLARQAIVAAISSGAAVRLAGAWEAIWSRRRQQARWPGCASGRGTPPSPGRRGNRTGPATASAAWAASPAVDAASVREAVRKPALPPSRRWRRHVSAALLVARAASTRPGRAERSAVARPIPLVVPVSRPILPVRSMSASPSDARPKAGPPAAVGACQDPPAWHPDLQEPGFPPENGIPDPDNAGHGARRRSRRRCRGSRRSRRTRPGWPGTGRRPRSPPAGPSCPAAPRR